jgi:lysozyme
MNAADLIYPRLCVEEGFRATPYKDSRGILTVGYGFNLQIPWSRELCGVILNWHIVNIDKQLSVYYWYGLLDEVRKSVMIDVAYNVGIEGLLHFPKMISALVIKSWDVAADELMDSDAAKTSPKRYAILAKILRTGYPS